MLSCGKRPHHAVIRRGAQALSIRRFVVGLDGVDQDQGQKGRQGAASLGCAGAKLGHDIGRQSHVTASGADSERSGMSDAAQD